MILPCRLLFLLQFVYTLSFNVKEEEAVGAYVGQLSNIDAQGTYCFESSCGWSQYFSLNQQIGSITTAAVIDRERLDSSTISVILSGVDSSGTNVLEVFDVVIDDINDNNPVFIESHETLYISENIGETSLDLLQWSDRDIGENGKLKSVQLIDLEDENWPFQPELLTSGNFQQVVLKVTRSLNREIYAEYNLTVEIQDNGFPTLSGFLDLRIIVQDSNDNTPTFNSSTFVLKINENFAVFSVIAQFSADDPDAGDNGKVQYFLSSNLNKLYFSIDQDTGQFYLEVELDYENCGYIRPNVKGYVVTVTARDMGSSPLESFVNVEIQVLDFNDNAPVISFYSPNLIDSNIIQLEENIPINSYVTTVLMADKDSGVNEEFDVTIDSGDYGMFKLEDTDGLVVLTAVNIDREQRDSYNIIISATDRGVPPLTSTKSLIIDILDVNDNAPVFTKSVYEISVEEDIVIDTFILSVVATDLDNGVNGSIVYQIDSQDFGPFFKVSSTGRISNIRLLDAETAGIHILNISASDQGSPSLKAYTMVKITVLDVNDNTPIFGHLSYICETDETAPVNTKVCSVEATDGDSGTNGLVHYSILSNSPLFSIDSTGEITISSKLDFEISDIYKLTVKAEDQGSTPRYTTCVVIININDINDELPTFDEKNYFASIPENVIYSSIVQAAATDLDAGDTVSYSLLANTQYFSISSAGVISNTQKFNYATSSSYTFMVKAVDSSGNESPTNPTVTISVLQNTDDLPVFTEGIFEVSIAEDEPLNSIIATITATVTSSCVLSYRLQQPSIFFDLDSSSGALEVIRVPDYEDNHRFIYDVIATCNTIAGFTKVHINIRDVNDNSPECQSTPDIFVEENTSIGTMVYSLACFDADSGLNKELQYSLDSPYFNVDTATGDISVNGNLDRETQNVINLAISICDEGTPILCISYDLTIRILDINDNTPQFVAPLTFYVSEDVKENFEIGTIKAVDMDLGKNGRISFTVLNSVSDIAVFGSGQIVVQKSLDFERIDHYYLSVKAADSGTPQRDNTTLITIIVEDANDNTPVFDEDVYNFDIDEDAEIPFTLGYITATDQDSGSNGDISYSLIDNKDTFDIDSASGLLELTAILDYEGTETSYEIRVVASDKGVLPRNAQVNVVINIIDVNDNSPVFSQKFYTKLVPEDVEVDYKVCQVHASDNDGISFNKVSYKFADDISVPEFTLDHSSGNILVNQELDYETKNEYNITVIAEDNGSPPLSTSTYVIISLSDINDNAPLFETTLVKIDVVESTQPGTVIQQIKAADKDVGDNGKITYSIISESDTGYFSIDGTSGDLTLLQKLTFSTHKVYELTLEATDHGVPSLSDTQDMKISVIDVNDNAPKFVDSVFSINITENIAIGTKLFEVSATDSDSGPAGLVNYNISSSFFRIDKAEGEVFVNDEIDREEQKVIILKICAYDQAFPVSEQLSTCKEVTVYVGDVNDNVPIFTDDGKFVFVHEGSPLMSKITRINVTDADEGYNASLVFSITSQDPDNTVSIDSDTGDLYLRKSQDFENNSTACSFEVTVTDRGVPPLENSKMMILTVIDDNDNAPVFTNPASQRKVFVATSTKNGSVIYVAQATDADQEQNSQIQYSLKSGPSYIVINQVSGEISIIKDVTISFQDQSLTVIAKDNGTPALQTSMTVSVIYSEENSKPTCPSKVTISIDEDMPIGSLVFTVDCYDLDWGSRGSLKYTILSGNYDGVFQVHANGEIVLVKNLDYEKYYKLNVIVLVEDHGKPSLKELSEFVVNINNINDNAPIFGSKATLISLSELSAAGTLVETLLATDLDGDSITYSITDITTMCSELFVLNPQSGQLTLSQEISDIKFCSVVVTATDGVYTGTTTLSINIADEDDNKPQIYSPSSFLVSYSAYVVGVVGAMDDDDGDRTISYSIKSSKRAAEYVISSDTGVISCPTRNCPPGDISVTASGRTLSTDVTVSISTNSLTVVPVFDQAQFRFTVEESRDPGYIVGHIPVVNVPDSLAIDGGNLGDSFKVENSDIVVKMQLDREIWSHYNLTVHAMLDGISSFVSVYISVEDVNDNNPVFMPSFRSVEITTEIPVPSKVIEVEAIDPDEGFNGKVIYEMLSNQYFRVDSTTGIVYSKNDLYGQGSEHVLQIKATDQGSQLLSSKSSNQLELLIKVKQIPRQPEFISSPFVFSTFANAAQYSIVGSIELKSSQSESQYTFSFEPTSSHFLIYSDSGIIVQKNPINNSSLLQVHETVYATAVSNTSISQSEEVKINIIKSICDPNPCGNDGICNDLIESYECKCKAGTAGRHCQCIDSKCPNGGSCVYDLVNPVTCLCSNGQYRDECNPPNYVMAAIILGGCAVILIIALVIVIVCVTKYKSKKKKKKDEAVDEFDNAVMSARLGSNRRPKGQLYLNDNMIRMNPINVSSLDTQKMYPEYCYTNHDYDLDSPRNLNSPPLQAHASFPYAESDSGHSSQCTEAVIFRKLKNVDLTNIDVPRRHDKDSGLAGSLNTLSHFDTDFNNSEAYTRDYLVDWGPRVQNLANVLDLDDIMIDDDTLVKEEFV